MKFFLVLLVDTYRLLSFDGGLLSFFAPGGACKYTPSCSVYTRQSILKYGALRGALMGIRRIVNCR